MAQVPGRTRVALLSFAHMHAYAYAAALKASSAVDFVGIWDDVPARGEEQAKSHDTRYWEDLDRLLADQRLDGVIVTAENVFHSELIERAASAGVRAILCEKPLAPTIADAKAAIKHCEAAGAFLATAFPCRYSPAFERAKAVVHSGQIGDVLAIRGANRGKCPFGWFVDKDKSGGGAVMDHTVHVADLNRVLLGKEAVEVYALTSNGMHHQDWEDCGFLTITYEGGVFSTLDTSWSRPQKSYPAWGDVTLEIVGTAGVVSIDVFNQSLALYSEESGNGAMVHWGSDIDAGMIDEFLQAARGEKPERLATGEDGLKAVEVTVAAYESVRTGRPVLL